MASSATQRGRDDDALVVNPLAAVLEVEAGSNETLLEVYAPQRGKPLSASVIRSGSEPDLHAALRAVYRAEGVSVMSVMDVIPSLRVRHGGRLRELGLLVPKERVSSWPLFRCATLSGAPTDALPNEVRELLSNRSHFSDGHVVGLKDRVTGLLFPYWRGARPGATSRSQGSTRTRLARQRWKSRVDESRAHLASDGYAAIRGAIPGDQLGALRRYLGRVVDNGLAAFLEDTRRWTRHGDPVTRLFHQLITPLMRSVIAEPVKPSYPYFAAYPLGSNLKKHTDREQCEYTVSLLVGYEPGGRGELAWPIYLEPRGRTRVELRQRPGDILVFKGREIPHARPRLRTATRSLHIFFHYVPLAFEGPLG
jgi:hypothetical protein